ncbi:MAG: hypothetical protein CMH55_11200 [Myxococcales bacterium]|nr:hypothetical protein [Myxococcales bacterium]
MPFSFFRPELVVARPPSLWHRVFVGTLDLALLVIITLGTLALGLFVGRKQTSDTDGFLLGGRDLPWWLAGTSMVATTFAVDTPLVVAGVTATKGLAGNWFWWGLLFSHLLVTFFLAARWQGTGCTTDAEVVTLRYGDSPTALWMRRLRGFYFALPINLFVMGWVLAAGAKVLAVILPWERWLGFATIAEIEVRCAGITSLSGSAVVSLFLCLAIGLSYSATSGLKGVVVTDLVQFALAMIGGIALTWAALQVVGGPAALGSALEARGQGLPPDLAALSLLGDPTGLSLLDRWQQSPPLGDPLALIGAHGDLALTALLVSWWANKNADGGGVLIQRTLACKNPRQGFFALAWFSAAHYLLRPWLWVVVGWAAIVLLPGPPQDGWESTYPQMLTTLLPAGWLGLAGAGLVAALISTADTHLHWGASYLANDLTPARATAATRLRVARWGQVIMALLAAVIALQMDSIAQAWKVLLVLGAGLGPPTLLRWFWWRVSAQAELAAFLIGSLCAAWVLWGFDSPPSYAMQMLSVGGAGLLATVVASLIWPADRARAEQFFQQVQPGTSGGQSALGFAGAAVCLLGGTAGLAAAFTGSSIGWILGLGGLLGYGLVVRWYGQQLQGES